MYLLKTDGSDQLIQAWCEHGLDNGGWTVLQRRKDGSMNFFRNWENYKVSPGSGGKLGLNGPERFQRETFQWKKCHLIFTRALRFVFICLLICSEIPGSRDVLRTCPQSGNLECEINSFRRSLSLKSPQKTADRNLNTNVCKSLLRPTGESPIQYFISISSISTQNLTDQEGDKDKLAALCNAKSKKK